MTRLSPQERALRDVSEKQWQAQVIEALGYCGWVHYHTFDSLKSNPGFPDLVCIHPRSGDHFVAELKRERGAATPAQLQWLAWFEATGWDAYLWRPSDVDVMLARVQRTQLPLRS